MTMHSLTVGTALVILAILSTSAFAKNEKNSAATRKIANYAKDGAISLIAGSEPILINDVSIRSLMIGHSINPKINYNAPNAMQVSIVEDMGKASNGKITYQQFEVCPQLTSEEKSDVKATIISARASEKKISFQLIAPEGYRDQTQCIATVWF